MINCTHKDIPWVVVSLGKFLFAVVVRSPKNGAGPVGEEPLSLSLNGQLGPLALDVEHNHLADTRCDKCVLVDRQLRQ